MFQLCIEEEDITIDAKTFIKNQERKYNKIVSQISRYAQILMSMAILIMAREHLPSGSYSEWANETYHLPNCRRKQ